MANWMKAAQQQQQNDSEILNKRHVNLAGNSLENSVDLVLHWPVTVFELTIDFSNSYSLYAIFWASRWIPAVFFSSRSIRFLSLFYFAYNIFFPFPILIQTPRVANECANAHKLRFSHVLSYKTYYDIEYIRNIQMNNTHAMWTIREINFKRFLTHTSTRPIRETLIEFHAYDGICMCF